MSDNWKKVVFGTLLSLVIVVGTWKIMNLINNEAISEPQNTSPGELILSYEVKSYNIISQKTLFNSPVENEQEMVFIEYVVWGEIVSNSARIETNCYLIFEKAGIIDPYIRYVFLEQASQLQISYDNYVYICSALIIEQ